MVFSDFSDSCTWVPPVSNARPTTPVLSSFQPAKPGPNPTLAQLTTIGTGGRVADFRRTDTEGEFLDSIKEADAHQIPLLILGGGSNLFANDTDFPGMVLQDGRQGVKVAEDSACGGAIVRAPAGQPWDEFVCACIDNDQAGLESLSGIPGTVGAGPVQNVGAYGYEVSQTLSAVKVYDRLLQGCRKLPAGSLLLGYRTSVIKRSLTQVEAGGGRTWGPSGRFIVLEAEFQLSHASLSLPIKYSGLAARLGVNLGTRVDLRELREAVLGLRREKGMVLDPGDPDTYSCGSFFTNPIIGLKQAESLPAAAPRWPVYDLGLTNPVTGKAPQLADRVKVSAAWLIEQAGFPRGFQLPDRGECGSSAGLSTKHVLALTNRVARPGGGTLGEPLNAGRPQGNWREEEFRFTESAGSHKEVSSSGSLTSIDGSAAAVYRLCQHIQLEVAKHFGVDLVPEPVLLGF